MLGLLGLLAVLPIISACAGNKGSDESRKEKMVQSVSVVQPITGTWINLAYKDVRNKYPHRSWRLLMKGKHIIRQS